MAKNNNPIYYSDLIKPDNSISDLIKQLETLEAKYTTTMKEVREEAERLIKVLEQTSNATEAGRQQTRHAATDAERLANAQRQLEEATGDVASELEKLRQAKREAAQLTKLEVKLNSAAEGSYDQLSAQYALNKIRLNQMSDAQRNNTEQGKKLEQETAAIMDRMKALQEATGKYTLDVGHYSKAMEGLSDKLINVGGATGAVTKGFGTIGVAAKGLAANPIMAMVIALAAIFNKLIEAFKKTEEGMTFMNKAGAVLSGTMNIIVKVSQMVFNWFGKIFKDPVGWIKDLGTAIVQNIYNRFVSISEMGKGVFRVLKGIFTLDTKELKAGLSDTGDAATKFVTGLDKKQVKGFTDTMKDLTSSVVEQVNAFTRLADAKRKAMKDNRAIQKQIADLSAEEELQQAIADDATKSFAEREAAAAKADELTKKRAQLELDLAKQNLGFINREIELKQKSGEVDDELLDKQVEAYREAAEAQKEYDLAVRDNEKRQSELKQDRLEKDLDILIDGFDNQKTINERLVKDDTKTFEERRKILDATTKLADESFKKQIETIEQFTDVSIDADDLINEKDAVALNNKIRSLGLSEIIEGRLLEIIRERRTATLDLTEAYAELADKERKALEKGKEETKPTEEAEVTSDFYSMIGLKLDDKQKEGIQSSKEVAIQAINDIADAKVAAADRAVEAADREVESARDALRAEIEAKNAGYASNVALAQKELDNAKKMQDKALKQQERARKVQVAMQSVEQAGNLVTASSKIWAQLGAYSIPAIALMWASFAASKVQAIQATKVQYGEGTIELLEGGSHASGNDIDMGRTKDGRRRRAEGGEFFAIINKRNSRKYRNVIPDVINAFNEGNFDDKFMRGSDAYVSVNAQTDITGLSADVREIKEQNQKRIFNDGSKTIVTYKNLTQITR